MTDELLPELPEPSFQLKWRNAAYYVSEPNIGDTDVFTADQLRAYAREAIRLAQRDAARYRFIRGMSWGARMDEDGPLATLHDEELDNAIDAAMQPSPPAGEVA